MRCGSFAQAPGFADVAENGTARGFEVDFCRALAAAVLGSTESIDLIRLEGSTRFTALQDKEVDVLFNRVTWSFERDATLGVTFTAINFYEGQGFAARKSLGIATLADVRSAKVCVMAGTTSERNLAAMMRERQLQLEIIAFRYWTTLWEAVASGNCDLVTDDRSSLASRITGLRKLADDLQLLPDVISREPLAPVVRDDDPAWADIVRWMVFATIIAEEHGITAANVDAQRSSSVAEVRRLLGQEPVGSDKLGLDPQWAYRIIKQVGNYGEIFERNLGRSTPLGLDRGLNALWTHGGLLFAPPL